MSITLARPYAKAAFEYALEKHELSAWANMLENAASVVTHPHVVDYLTDPRITVQNWVQFITDICASNLNDAGKNFLQLLADNRRLKLLPDITKLFTQYQALHEKRTDVRVISAFPLNAEEQSKLENALQIRFSRSVSLQCEVDSTLLGGAVIRMGDQVIDGSIRNSLKQLLDTLR